MTMIIIMMMIGKGLKFNIEQKNGRQNLSLSLTLLNYNAESIITRPL